MTATAILDRRLGAFEEAMILTQEYSPFNVVISLALAGAPPPEALRAALDAGIAGAVATSGTALNVPDAQQDPRFDARADRATGFRTRSVLCAPSRDADGRVVAVAQALNRRDGKPFDAEDAARFAALVEPLGVLLQAWAEMAAERTPLSEVTR